MGKMTSISHVIQQMSWLDINAERKRTRQTELGPLRIHVCVYGCEGAYKCMLGSPGSSAWSFRGRPKPSQQAGGKSPSFVGPVVVVENVLGHRQGICTILNPWLYPQ